MPPHTLPGSADSKNKFEDLSGVNIAAYSNPYDALIEACGDDPVETLFLCTTSSFNYLYTNLFSRNSILKCPGTHSSPL
jgi:hypothetical protein